MVVKRWDDWLPRLSVLKVSMVSLPSRLQLLEGCFSLPPRKMEVHVADDGIGVVLVDSFELGLCLQHQAGGDFTASDGGNQLFQVWDLPDIGELVNEAPHMDRQPPAVHVVRLFAEQVEQHMEIRKLKVLSVSLIMKNNAVFRSPRVSSSSSS